jgi:hypothetical protein
MMHKFPQSADADLICASLNTSFDIWSGSRMGSPAAALFLRYTLSYDKYCKIWFDVIK